MKVNTCYLGGYSCYSLPELMTTGEAREYMRKWLNIKRLPNNTSFSHVEWRA